MPNNPCAFFFPYTNYSDAKALFHNFRHLEAHLNRIGCGNGVEDASWVMAASDSSAADKLRADEVCDGVDDDLQIRAAILLNLPAGGTIGFLPGHYIFTEPLQNGTAPSLLQENTLFNFPLWLRGSPGAVFQYEANPSSEKPFIYCVDNSSALTVPAVSYVSGIQFDAQGFANVSAALTVGSVGEEPIWEFSHVAFNSFKGDNLIQVGRFSAVNVSNCTFFDCDPTNSFFLLGGFSEGTFIAHDLLFLSCSGELWTGAGFSQGGLIYNWNADVALTVTIDSLVPVFHYRNGTGTYTAGAHTGLIADHGALTGLTDNDHTQYLLHSVADAKGDIAVASANDVWDNLTVGSNQTVPVADSTQTLGLRYALPGGKDSIYGWYDVDLADALTNDQMTRSVGVLGVTMAYPGSIVAIMVNSTEARTAGTATFEVFKNGTGIGLTAVLDGTNTTKKVTTQAFATDTFVAGDVLDIRVTTSGWTPTTADVEAGLVVQYDS